MAHTALKAALIASATMLGATAAIAQFGSIFGEPPPRPPGAVPGGRQVPAPPQDYYPPPPPPQDYSYPPPSRANPPPQGYPSQSRQYPAQQGPYGPYGGVQSQPLPPPGTTAPAPRAPAGQEPVTGLPPAQRQPKAPPKTAVAPPPSDETLEPPPQRIANPTALFSGLDKITGRIINFDVAIGETVQFGALQLTTRACFTRPPTETANTDAFVEVDEVTLQGEVRRIFTGWMFAASPGLHAIEHPIYDLWLTDCKGGAQNVASDTTGTQSTTQEPPAKPRAKPRPKPPQTQRAQPRQLPQQGYPPFR